MNGAGTRQTPCLPGDSTTLPGRSGAPAHHTHSILAAPPAAWAETASRCNECVIRNSLNLQPAAIVARGVSQAPRLEIAQDACYAPPAREPAAASRPSAAR